MSEPIRVPSPPALPLPLAQRIKKQDEKYGGFEPTVRDMRLAVACLQDEVEECVAAWRANRKNRNFRRAADAWYSLYDELLDVAAISIRALAALDESGAPT